MQPEEGRHVLQYAARPASPPAPPPRPPTGTTPPPTLCARARAETLDKCKNFLQLIQKPKVQQQQELRQEVPGLVRRAVPRDELLRADGRRQDRRQRPVRRGRRRLAAPTAVLDPLPDATRRQLDVPLIG